MKKISVLGSGAWGTALALKLSQNSKKNQAGICLWGRNQQSIDALKKGRHPRLKGIDLSCLQVTNHWDEAVRDAEAILICVPSIAFVETLGKLYGQRRTFHLAWACKGFNSDFTQKKDPLFFSDIVQKYYTQPASFITGPSFALETAADKPTALLIAGEASSTQYWSKLLHGQNLRTYVSTEQKTAELGAAIKNIIAIAVGVSDGLELGANARVALITRGLKEMKDLAKTLGGGDLATLYGLSGLGDALLTSTDNHSRNRQLGIALAQKKSFESELTEGIFAVKTVKKISQLYQLKLPICDMVYQVVTDQILPEVAVTTLLKRAPVDE